MGRRARCRVRQTAAARDGPAGLPLRFMATALRVQIARRSRKALAKVVTKVVSTRNDLRIRETCCRRQQGLHSLMSARRCHRTRYCPATSRCATASSR